MLQDGMETLSQARVGSALQVFFNLEELQQVRFLHSVDDSGCEAWQFDKMGREQASSGYVTLVTCLLGQRGM
jgi:hypothetical protein